MLTPNLQAGRCPAPKAVPRRWTGYGSRACSAHTHRTKPSSSRRTGSISAPYRLHIGSISAPYRLCIGSISAPYRLCISAPYRPRFCSIPGPYQFYIGSASGCTSALYLLHIGSPSGSMSAPRRLITGSVPAPYRLSVCPVLALYQLCLCFGSAPYRLYIGTTSARVGSISALYWHHISSDRLHIGRISACAHT